MVFLPPWLFTVLALCWRSTRLQLCCSIGYIGCNLLASSRLFPQLRIPPRASINARLFVNKDRAVVMRKDARTSRWHGRMEGEEKKRFSSKTFHLCLQMSDDAGWSSLETFSGRDNRPYNKGTPALLDNCFFLAKKFSFTSANEVTGWVPRENLITMTRLRFIMESSIRRSPFTLSSPSTVRKIFSSLCWP